MALIKDGILCGPQEEFKIWYESFGQYLYDCLKSRDPNDIIAIDPVLNETLTVRDVLQKSVKLSIALRQMSLKKGEVVGVISENTLDYYVAVLAILFSGAITFPINFAYTPRELKHAFNIAQPNIVLCSLSVLPNVLKVNEEYEIKLKLITIDDSSDSNLNYQSMSSLIQNHSNVEDFQVETVDAEDSMFLCLSSGTTGLPKCVNLSHKNLILLANAFGDERSLNVSKHDVIVSVLPFFHIYGLWVHLSATYNANKIVLMKSFKPDVYLRSIQDYKVTKLFLVPTMLQFLLQSPLVNNYDISSLKDIMIGAAPLGKELFEQAVIRFKDASIRQLYGATEVGGLVSVQNPKDKDKSENVGRLVPNLQCKFIDLYTAKPTGPLELGEICIKAISVMKGYYNNETETKNSFDDDGFYRTGDIGYYNEDGKLYIVDRIKEIIKYKGFQVPPSELENILLGHPAVQDCGVIGIPHERAGEVPLAFVVKKSTDDVTEKELVQLVADNLSVHKHLYGGVRFIEKIPRTASGKILRRELKALL